LFAVLAPAAAAPAHTSQIDFAALDRGIETQMSKHGIPDCFQGIAKTILLRSG
jgi:hypothetical protein